MARRTQVRRAARERAHADASTAILETAIVHLAERGPAGIHPRDVCDELGLSKALVNYHFGGRDGLVGAAMAVAYERRADEAVVAVSAAGADPEARLSAWIDFHVDWAVTNPGLAAALAFPHLTGTSDAELSEDVARRIAASRERNSRLLEEIVAEVRRARRGDASDAATREAHDGLDAAAIGWVALGMSVWRAGDAPVAGEDQRDFFPVARDYVRSCIGEMLAR